MARKKTDVPPKDRVVGGKTMALWDKEWRRIEGGFTEYHGELRHKVGLFRANIGTDIVYIGQGSQYIGGGGLAKRLSDFRRYSPSARNHYAGNKIRKHIENLTVDILITGTGSDGSDIAKLLRNPMIELHDIPAWNAEARMRKIRAKA